MGMVQRTIFKEILKMTNKEKIKRDISLAFDFAGKIIETPELLNDIPDNTTLRFISNDQVLKEKTKDRIKKKYIRVVNQFEIL
jgi:hypothetical protein